MAGRANTEKKPYIFNIYFSVSSDYPNSKLRRIGGNGRRIEIVGYNSSVYRRGCSVQRYCSDVAPGTADSSGQRRADLFSVSAGNPV